MAFLFSGINCSSIGKAVVYEVDDQLQQVWRLVQLPRCLDPQGCDSARLVQATECWVCDGVYYKNRRGNHYMAGWLLLALQERGLVHTFNGVFCATMPSFAFIQLYMVKHPGEEVDASQGEMHAHLAECITWLLNQPQTCQKLLERQLTLEAL